MWMPSTKGCPMCIHDKLGLLTHTQSITQYLRQQYTHVTVECLKVWVDVDQVLHRDIQIHANGKIQWCARTDIPPQTQQELKKHFDWQGDKPLGDFLFTSPHVLRKKIQLKYENQFPVWVRRLMPYEIGGFVRTSIWVLNSAHSFTITEYFSI